MTTNQHKLEWLEALSKHKPTRGAAHDIAILLVCRYLDSWPGVNALAAELGISQRGCIYALKSLVQYGWLEKTQRAGRHGSRYRLRRPLVRRQLHPSAVEQVQPVHGGDQLHRDETDQTGSQCSRLQLSQAENPDDQAWWETVGVWEELDALERDALQRQQEEWDR